VRFIVEVLPAEDERVEGTVRRDGLGQAVHFCGWLELLRLLEPGVSANERNAASGLRSVGG